jgi:ERCC4-related helicase
MRVSTPSELLSLIAPGAMVEVRDEEWLVRSTQQTPSDGLLVRCIGTSTLVRDTESTFSTNLDRVVPMRPEETHLVQDDSPNFRTARLYLEAILRKTPLPATNTDLAVAQHQLLNPLEYQRRSVHKALTGLRPRLLIADAVGLGKTLEVGMILSELIRRGRGEKILVVTPRHILEQFQHELWTRFAIPLVRLDSEGIQRIRRKIPGNRNPFTYYKRAIISIDTLKNVGRYRHHLEGIRWDAVVIDECHNLVNRGTLNNQLARVLAPRTEALLLTSATPHNGDPKSFAELVRLLDPTAIADPDNIKHDDIDHLYVRRHKASAEVAAEVGADWADRKPPRPIPVEPTAPEQALFEELADTWTHPVSGSAPASGAGRSLFPWTLFKAALSSHHALAQTIEQRRKTLASASSSTGGTSRDQEAEDRALETLHERALTIGDETSSKLQALVEQLRTIDVGPRSPTRVVVFSERIATLDWLARVVPTRLELQQKHVRVLHGGLADVKQMDVIEEFGLGDSNVRLLFTGDMASEGVNLHRECHHLIHFDLPWSLITIEQRNGRIDRYGQRHSPDIRALVQTPDHPHLTGDVRILTRLLEREHQAHRAFGESGSLLGLHDAAAEEESVMRSLRDGVNADNIFPTEPSNEFDLLTILGGATGNLEVALYRPPTLFGSDRAFVEEALAAAFDDAYAELDIRTEVTDPTLCSLVPPKDLVRRLAVLPQSYLNEQKVTERLRATADAQIADEQLAQARKSTTSSWPTVGYLSPLHPLIDWLADKVLVAVGRNQAPVLKADVSSPVFCVQGLYSNGRGQPQLVEWLAVFQGPSGSWMVDDLFATLQRADVGPDMPNDGTPVDTTAISGQLTEVVTAAREELDRRLAVHDAAIEERLAAPAGRLHRWVDATHQLMLDLDDRHRPERDRYKDAVADDTTRLIESMKTSGQPLIRVLAVLVGSSR